MNVMYEVERFKTQRWKNLKKCVDNIVNALKEGVERIDTWFKKYINKL